MDTDVDLSEFFAMTYKKPCKVKAALDALKAPERKKLEAAIAVDAGRLPHTVIKRWIEGKVPELGALTPTVDAVARHRNGACSCD